ncbi:MAG: beta-lactamase family protein [Bacteroidota bacterium]|nr:beta-lactamase family protein [Bacteroidota bacterium]
MKTLSRKFPTIIFSLKIIFTIILSGILCNNSFSQTNAKNLEIKLDAIIDSFYVNDSLPGIVVGIFTPEFTYKKIVGRADLKTGVDRQYDDKIRIGSITKTFVTTVILQLVDEGKLSIDDKLSKFYPQVPNSDSITLRQVMDMTSGIPDYLNYPLLDSSFTYARLNKFTPQEILDATISLKPDFPPGKGWKYSNGNYNILGMIVEKITGNKVEDEINTRIIKPLNLVNTSFPTTPYMEGQYSHGYMRDTATHELIDVTVIDPSITWAAGAMISNMDDLKIFENAISNGTLLSAATQKERLKFVGTGVKDFLKYGLGMFYLDGFIGHNGGITGYNTMMSYNPDLQTTILVSLNEYGVKGGKVDIVFIQLAKALFPDKNLFE